MVAGYKKISTLSKGQQRVHDTTLQQIMQMLTGGQANIQQSPLFQAGSSYLQNLLSGSPESTAAFEAPALRQFQEQIIPMLAERFSGIGAGAQSSSAFSQALGSAGAGLAEDLADLRARLQQGAAGQALGYAQQPVSNLFGLSQLGLGTQAQGFVPKQTPFWQQLLTGLGGGLAQIGGQFGTQALGKKWGLI